jgi:hypothetical protein
MGKPARGTQTKRAAMNRSGLVLAIVVAVVIGAGCSGDDPAPASADSSPSGRQEADDDPTHSPSGEKDDPPVKGAQPVGADGNLPAGVYFTDLFVTQAVFKVGAGYANDETVLIFVEAPAESFDEFSALAEDVLKTVRFPSA